MSLFSMQVYINWMNFLVNLLIPIAVLVYMNCAIYRDMPRMRSFQRPVAVPSTAAAAAGTSNLQPENGGSNAVRNSFRATLNGKKLSTALPGESEAMRKQREKEQKQDTTYTKASILMVMVFLFCHGPRFATNVMELLFFDAVQRQSEVSETAPILV